MMGRNLVKSKKFDDVIIVILMSRQGSGKSSLFICFWMD